ncbi:MAG: GspH/FimT family pseudopilin [Granulosicoccus sp.]
MKESAGFTLIELLVGIAVLTVLVSVALPNFQSIVSDTRQVTLYNKASSTMRYARSEAIKRSTAVSICARATDTSCGDDWSNGMLVFQDSINDGSALTYDGTDTVLRTISAFSPGMSMTSTALLASDATTPAATSVIRFNQRGRPNWLSGTIVLCDGRGAAEARALIMTGSGIGRRAYSTENSDGVVVDARGTAVSCS